MKRQIWEARSLQVHYWTLAPRSGEPPATSRQTSPAVDGAERQSGRVAEVLAGEVAARKAGMSVVDVGGEVDPEAALSTLTRWSAMMRRLCRPRCWSGRRRSRCNRRAGRAGARGGLHPGRGELFGLGLTHDAAAGTVSLVDHRGEAPVTYVLTVELSGEQMVLRGGFAGAQLSVNLRRIDTENMLLLTRGFHWVNERPYNR